MTEDVRIIPVVVVRLAREEISCEPEIVCGVELEKFIPAMVAKPVASSVEFETYWIAIVIVVSPRDSVCGILRCTAYIWSFQCVPHFHPQDEVFVDRRANRHQPPHFLN